MTSKPSFLHDDSKLHKLCQDGNYRKVTEFVNNITDPKALEDRLANRKGVFGYTPLHEAVASGHHKVLDFLLGKAGDGHVNCRANSGYTPLHLAASSGHGECVRVLLRHNADISVTDEYGKTPKQTAELSSKSSIVKILRSAGEWMCLHVAYTPVCPCTCKRAEFLTSLLMASKIVNRNSLVPCL